MENDARRKAEVRLRLPEKIGIQTVCLNAPGHSLHKATIEPTAYCP